MGAVKLVSVAFDFSVYTEMKKIAKNNDIPLSELVRRCCEIGLKKIAGAGRGAELKE